MSWRTSSAHPKDGAGRRGTLLGRKNSSGVNTTLYDSNILHTTYCCSMIYSKITIRLALSILDHKTLPGSVWCSHVSLRYLPHALVESNPSGATVLSPRGTRWPEPRPEIILENEGRGEGIHPRLVARGEMMHACMYERAWSNPMKSF